MPLFSPPSNVPIINAFGVMSREWALFFENISNGDPGDTWTPTWSGLTVVGSPTYDGRFYRLSKNLQFVSVVITTAGTTASTAGTTYIANWPNMIKRDSAIMAVNSTTHIGIGTGMANASNNRIYTPTWGATANTITITGIINGL